MLCFAALARNTARLSPASLRSFCKSAQFISLLNKFNTDTVRTASVVGGWVGFWGGKESDLAIGAPCPPQEEHIAG